MNTLGSGNAVTEWSGACCSWDYNVRRFNLDVGSFVSCMARVSSRKKCWGGSSGKCRAKCFEVN